MWSPVKVVIEGHNFETDEKLCIIKKGDFLTCSDDFLEALRQGWVDKHNEFAPEFELKSFRKQERKENLFAAVVHQIHDNGKQVEAIFHLDVTFKQLERKN